MQTALQVFAANTEKPTVVKMRRMVTIVAILILLAVAWKAGFRGNILIEYIKQIITESLSYSISSLN